MEVQVQPPSSVSFMESAAADAVPATASSAPAPKKASKWAVASQKLKATMAFERLRDELAEESEATRLLKEVSRSVSLKRANSRFDSKNYLNSRRISLEPDDQNDDLVPSASLPSLEITRVEAQGRRAQKRGGILQPGRTTEELVCQSVLDDPTVSLLLGESNRKVGAMEHELRTLDAKALRMRRAAKLTWPPNPDVQISEFADSGSSSFSGLGGSDAASIRQKEEKRREDRATTTFIRDRVQWTELDDLQGLIHSSDGFKDLRKRFVRTFEYHPRMKMMNDCVLRSATDLNEALEGEIPCESRDEEETVQSRFGFRRGSSTTCHSPKLPRKTRCSANSSKYRSNDPGG